MNSSYRPQSRLVYQMPTMALNQLSVSATSTAPRKAAGLSARQLFDIELGLFLLSELLPAAPPDALPALLADTPATLPERLTWTARQHRYLSRARLLLGHFRQPGRWLNQIERYALGSSFQQAYALGPERCSFWEKSVGFSRNRQSSLRQILG